jgi:hypothetical protein
VEQEEAAIARQGTVEGITFYAVCCIKGKQAIISCHNFLLDEVFHFRETLLTYVQDQL